MKKVMLLLISFVLVFSVVGCSGNYPENVRKDIYDRTAKYGIELVDEVESLKSKGNQHTPTKLADDIIKFVDKYSVEQLTNQEKELLDNLLLSTNSYVDMMENQIQGDLSSFIVSLNAFDKSIEYLTNYYKK